MQYFNYSVSLHVIDPEMDPAVITRTLGLEPTRRTTRGGEPKTTPNGTPRDGAWDFSHWSHSFGTIEDQELVLFLRGIANRLRPNQEFLQQIVDEGGEIECFVGVFTDTNCDQVLPFDLLADFGLLRINLRLDLYGSRLRQREHPSSAKE